jgi:hypothetical protein
MKIGTKIDGFSGVVNGVPYEIDVSYEATPTGNMLKTTIAINGEVVDVTYTDPNAAVGINYTAPDDQGRVFPTAFSADVPDIAANTIARMGIHLKNYFARAGVPSATDKAAQIAALVAKAQVVVGEDGKPAVR